MATAYKCDRCNKYYDKYFKSIRALSNGSDIKNYDICAECFKLFENFMKEGVINEQ